MKTLIKPLFPVTNKEIHRFIFYPDYFVIPCYDVVNTGLFLSKFDSFSYHENVHFPLFGFFRRKISIIQVVNDFQFWFAVLAFFKKYELKIQYGQVQTILDYFRFQRYGGGNVTDFQINGRSLNLILNDVEQWHLSLVSENNIKNDKKVTWAGHRIRNFDIELDGVPYSIIQLKSDSELFIEGNVMKHCVFSYLDLCYKGTCSIWSLRRNETNGLITRLSTIEKPNYCPDNEKMQ